MRRITCDQYEFDPPDSEQCLELALSNATRYPDLGAFLEACGASASPGRVLELGWGDWEMVQAHLRRFAGLELPDLGECREAVLIRNDWDDIELAIRAGDDAIWYHWFTTA